MRASSIPVTSVFNFASPGAVQFNASAPNIILRSSTVHVLAWVYVDNNGMPADQKVFTIPGVLTLGTAAPGGSGPVLYPEVWDNQGNRYAFQAGRVPTDKWALIEVIWTRGGNLAGLVNGVQVQSIPVSANPLKSPSNNPTNNYVGSFWDGSSFPFMGMIQSVLMTNAADLAATQAYAITPSGAISNWGASGFLLSGEAAVTTLSAPPATPYAAPGTPPAPTEIGEQMPAAVSAGQVFQMIVPGADSSTYTMLAVAQSWQQLAGITGQPNLNTVYEVSITTGVNVTGSQTQTLGMSVGLRAGFNAGILNAQVNLTLSYSESFTQQISITEQATITKAASVNNPPVTTTGVWWQSMATFSTFQVINNGAPLSAIVADPRPDIYSVAYPPGSTQYLQIADANAPAKQGATATVVKAARRG